MAYKLHQAVDLVNASNYNFTALPTSKDFIITARGGGVGSGAENQVGMRPNGDSTSGNYKGASSNVTAAGVTGGSAVTTLTHMWIGQMPLNGSFLGQWRLSKSGGAWAMVGEVLEGTSTPALSVGRVFFQVWNSVVSSISSLSVRFDFTNSTNLFSGRLELWYQDA